MGLSVGDIYSAIQLMLAPVYVNDFVHEGRVKRVHHAGRRAVPHRCRIAVALLHAQSDGRRRRNGLPTMIPLSQRGQSRSGSVASPSLTRYNGYRGGGDRRFAGAGPQLGRGDEGDAEDRRATTCRRASATTGRASPTRKSSSGNQAHDADGAVDRGGVPVPGGAVRELVGAGGGAAGGAAGRAGRGGCSRCCAACRTTSTSRSA